MNNFFKIRLFQWGTVGHFLIFSALILLGVVTIFQIRSSEKNISAQSYEGFSKDYTVVFGKDGFSPASLKVYVGDRVTFISENEVLFWPASDPHPTHEIFSLFDSKKNISVGERWSFVFEQSGIWRYHDHLSSTYRGTIEVLETTPRETTFPQCSYDKVRLGDLRCFDELVRSAIRTGGINEGWRVFQDLYAEGKAPRACHWVAHLIGEETFYFFKKSGNVVLSPATSYCGFGFYHGFVGKLLQNNPSPELAISFCKKVRDQLGLAAESNCFHGIGHGFTPDPPTVSQEGDAEAVLKPGLSICRNLFATLPLQESVCASGALSVITQYMLENKYGFKIDRKDPFSFCDTVPVRYKQVCITEMAPKLDSLTDWDVSKIPLYLNSIIDQQLREEVVKIAAGVMMQRDITLSSWDLYIERCRTLPSNLSAACLKGIVWGMTGHGEPTKEYSKPLQFCGSTFFTNEERRQCYYNLATQLSLIYSVGRVGEVCDMTPVLYKEVCMDGVRSSQNR